MWTALSTSRQIANRRIGKPDEVLSSVGDVVDAKITAIDTEKQKISLSIRALSKRSRRLPRGDRGRAPRGRAGLLRFFRRHRLRRGPEVE